MLRQLQGFLRDQGVRARLLGHEQLGVLALLLGAAPEVLCQPGQAHDVAVEEAVEAVVDVPARQGGPGLGGRVWWLCSVRGGPSAAS